MLRAWAADATPILSRPISVDDFDNQTGALTFLYQVKGEGTRKLAALAAGDTLTVTGPCGNGFDTAALACAHQAHRRCGRRHRHRAAAAALQGALPRRCAPRPLCRLPRYQLRHGELCALVPQHLFWPPIPAVRAITAL